jgi:arginine/lysine/ornithine decarboxylase
MIMDHRSAPVLDAVADFRRRGDVVYGPPGHKQGRGVDPPVLDLLGERAFSTDVLMLNGLDDRRLSKGILAAAEQLMADAVHAEHALFSTCGSSLSVKAVMLAMAGPGDRLVIARNSHKSVIAGLILSGIHPIWVRPRWDDALQVAHPPAAADIEEALDQHPEAKGVLTISPTDYGTCAELQETADVCHRRGIPFAVDEAWACHFPFHEDLPTWAMDAGADLCVTSIHKSGSGLEQSSCFHVQGDLVDPALLAARADLFSTTSPSALMYASIDGWRRQMMTSGHQLLDRALSLSRQFYRGVEGLPGIDVDPGRWRAARGVTELDPLKVSLDVWRLGLSGYDAAGWLREHCQVDVALADHRRVVVIFTHADDPGTVDRLITGLERLSSSHPEREQPLRTVQVPSPGKLDAELAMAPRDAFFATAEQVALADCPGRVCAELVSPYPPGVPVLAPGERVRPEHVAYIGSGVRHGMYIPDMADTTHESLRVVA